MRNLKLSLISWKMLSYFINYIFFKVMKKSKSSKIIPKLGYSIFKILPCRLDFSICENIYYDSLFSYTLHEII